MMKGGSHMKTDKNTERRITEMLAQMTVEEKIGQMMNVTPAIESLGIPTYDWWNEALHGVARSRFFSPCAGRADGGNSRRCGQNADEDSADFRNRRDSRSFAFKRCGDFSVTACGGLLVESSAC